MHGWHMAQAPGRSIEEVALPLDPTSKLLYLFSGRCTRTRLPNGADYLSTALSLTAPRPILLRELATAMANKCYSGPLPAIRDDHGVFLRVGQHEIAPELNMVCWLATLRFVDALRERLRCQAQDELVVVPLSARVIFATKSSQPM